MFAALHSQTLHLLCTPAPLSCCPPDGKPARGPPVLAHVAPLSHAPVHHAAGHPPARGSCSLQRATAILGRAEGSCMAPASPVAKREQPTWCTCDTLHAWKLLCTRRQFPKNPAQRQRGCSKLGHGAGVSSCATLLLQRIKCRAARIPNAPPAPADSQQPVSAI